MPKWGRRKGIYYDHSPWYTWFYSLAFITHPKDLVTNLPGWFRGRWAGHQGRSQITWGLVHLWKLWLCCARGRKGPGGSGLGASGALSTSSQPCGNEGSLTGAESLLRLSPTALLLCLNPPPVNRDPPPHPGTRKEVRMEVCVVRSPSVMGYLSAPLQSWNEVTVT